MLLPVLDKLLSLIFCILKMGLKLFFVSTHQKLLFIKLGPAMTEQTSGKMGPGRARGLMRLQKKIRGWGLSRTALIILAVQTLSPALTWEFGWPFWPGFGWLLMVLWAAWDISGPNKEKK